MVHYCIVWYNMLWYITVWYSMEEYTVEARKLEYDCPPTPRPREGKPAQVVAGPYSNILKSTVLRPGGGEDTAGRADAGCQGSVG